MIFVTEKDVICNFFFFFFFFFLQKKTTLFVPEKDVTIMGNDVTITLQRMAS